jgi:UDP-N-acetylglucosamine acyltransferase
MIHPTAMVHHGAEIAPDTEIGAYAMIGEHVRIAGRTRVGDHARIEGRTQIGEECRIFPFAILGAEPQDLKYRGEPTELIVGPRNVFREFVTIHRGTAQGGGRTVIGADNFFMSYAHVAHDCFIGNHVIMANSATLAGHIELHDHTMLGGIAAVHQFTRIGEYALVSGLTGVAQDIPPYTLASGSRAKLFGLNVVGLRRHGFSPRTIQALKQAYRILFRSNLMLRDGVERVRQEITGCPEVENLLRFVEESRRGVCR